MAVPWNQARTLAPSMRRPASSVTRPCRTTSGRSLVSRRKISRRNSSSVSTTQPVPENHGVAHSGARREQNSTQFAGSFGSQSEDGTSSGSRSGGGGPRPSQSMQPSGRSTHRTLCGSVAVTVAAGATWVPGVWRQAAPATATASTARADRDRARHKRAPDDPDVSGRAPAHPRELPEEERLEGRSDGQSRERRDRWRGMSGACGREGGACLPRRRLSEENDCV